MEEMQATIDQAKKDLSEKEFKKLEILLEKFCDLKENK
jgi:hypothetical protein